jgi:hypothetical protein
MGLKMKGISDDQTSQRRQLGGQRLAEIGGEIMNRGFGKLALHGPLLGS